MQLTTHFTSEEFTCKCGCNSAKMDANFMLMLEDTRMLANIPFKITSGYRCPTYNVSIGGKMNSAHTRGKAADIAAITSRHFFAIIKAALKIEFERIGIDFERKFVHLDNDNSLPQNVLWSYAAKKKGDLNEFL